MATMDFHIEQDGVSTFVHLPLTGGGEVVVAISDNGVSAMIMSAAGQQLISAWATHEEIKSGKLDDSKAEG
jgi:hypothetical protein